MASEKSRGAASIGCGSGGRCWRLGVPIAVALLLAHPVLANDERAAQPREASLGELPQIDPDHSMHTHKVVLITEDELNPATVELAPGQLIAWISYSPSESTVVFERDVAKSMVCHSRVNFSFEEGELRSTPIEAGEFASFCELKPGKYRYRVLRSSAPGAEAGRALEGAIVVADE